MILRLMTTNRSVLSFNLEIFMRFLFSILIAGMSVITLTGCNYLIGVKYNNDGYRYFLRDQNWEAVNYFDRALSKVSSSARTYNNRGLSHYIIGNYSQAMIDYNRSFAIHGVYYKTSNNRGVLYQSMKMDERAYDNWNAATQIEPDYPEPYFNRALMFLSHEDPEMALRNINLAIQKFENDEDADWVEAYVMRAQIHKRMGEWELANQDFQRVLDFIGEQDEFEDLEAGETNSDEKALKELHRLFPYDPIYQRTMYGIMNR